MPSFDLRDYAAIHQTWNPGGSSYITISTTPTLTSSTSSAMRELLGSVSDTFFGSSSTRAPVHSVGATVYAAGRTTNAAASFTCSGGYQIEGLEVYETVTRHNLSMSNIHAETQSGTTLSASFNSLSVSESGYVTFSFIVSNVPANSYVEISASLSGSVYTTYYLRSGIGVVHFGAQTTSDTTYEHVVSNWTDCSGSYTDTSTSGAYRVVINVTSTTISGTDGQANVSLTAYTKNDTAPTGIGCALTLTGTSTTYKYTSSGTRSISGTYTSVSNISPSDAQVDVSVSGTMVDYTCTLPYSKGGTSASFRVNYTTSGYYDTYYYWKIKVNGSAIGNYWSNTARYIYINGQQLDAYDYYYG